MAGMFKTGQELQQASLKDLLETQAKAINASARTPVEARNTRIGGMLGAGLATALGSKPTTAAGDIEKSVVADGADLQTSAGMMQLQRQLFDAGLHEDALKLDKPINDRLTIESKMAASKKGDKASKIVAPNDNELNATRAILIGDGTDFGELFRDMAESEDVAKMAQLDNMVSALATTEKSISAQLTDKGLQVNPHLIRTALAQSLADPETGVMADESWFGGLFGVDGVINTEKQNKVLAKFEKDVLKRFINAGKGDAAPVKTVEPQTTTQSPGTIDQVAAQAQQAPEVQETEGYTDIRGFVRDTPTGEIDKGTKLADPVAKKAQLDGYVQQLKAVTAKMRELESRPGGYSGPAMDEMVKLRKKTIEEIARLKQRP